MQVAHGSTIPIVVKAIVIYPFVNISTELLDFQRVIVGECLMMSVLVKNE